MSTTNLIELPAAARAALRELVDSNADSISGAFNAPTNLASWREAIERAQLQLAALDAADSLSVERDVADQLVPGVIALREDLRITVDSERRNRELYADGDSRYGESGASREENLADYDAYIERLSGELAGCEAFLAAVREAGA